MMLKNDSRVFARNPCLVWFIPSDITEDLFEFERGLLDNV